MPAYVVALIQSISDAETYKRYVAQVQPTLEAFGGRFIARVPGPHALEGGPAPNRAVILEFPGEPEARAWHASAPYKPVMELRQSASKGMLLLLPGYADAPAPRVPVGDVCYLEMVVTDPAATRAILEKTNGWRFSSPQQELGGAHVATLASGARLAIRAPMSPDETCVTRTYVRVADLDAHVRQLESLGATMMLEKMDIPGQGRIGIWDAGGAQFGAWQMP